MRPFTFIMLIASWHFYIEMALWCNTSYAFMINDNLTDKFLLYPPKRSLGGVYWIHPVRLSVCPSVRLSVCPSVRPSVRPSVGRCPDDNSNSFQWI